MADGFIQQHEYGQPGKRQDHTVTGSGDTAIYRQRVEVYSGETLPVSGTVAVSGNVEITNDFGNAIPVSGTVAATQSGTWSNVGVTNATLDVALSTRLKPADTLAGVTAVGSITNALPAGSNMIGTVGIADGANLDAFSRLRTSNTIELFSSMSEYGVNPYLWETKVVGSGSVTFRANENCARLTTGGTTDTHQAIRQSRFYLRYFPGRSSLIAMTFCMGASVTNGITRIGYFDESNGIFLQRSGSAISIVLRSKASGSVSDARTVAKADWSLQPNISLDFTMAQILVIDLQYLGVGRVRVGFVVGGQIQYVHEFKNSNTTLSTVYMSSGCLPIRYEVLNSGTTSAALTLDSICAVGLSEGADSEHGAAQFSMSNSVTSKTAGNNTYTPLVAIQAKTTGPNSVANRGHINFAGFGVFVGGNTAVHWRLIRNPATITGASWQSTDANSIANYDLSATAYTGGQVILSGYVATTASVKQSVGMEFETQFPIVYTALNGTQDVLMLAAAGIGATSAAYGQMNWTEEY